MKKKQKSSRSLLIKRDGIMCKACGWVGVSWTRHDYKTCPCKNEAMVDGGTDYLRYGAANMDHVCIVTVSWKKDKE